MHKLSHIAVVLGLAVSAAAACSWENPQPTVERQVVQKPTHRVAQPTTHTEAAPRVTQRTLSSSEQALQVALQQRGRPYVFGGSSPAGFDCSGLVRYAYSSVGVITPRTTRALWSELLRIPLADARPGDLLFFSTGTRPTHVGIYIGDGDFVHAPSTGKLVSVASVKRGYYERTFIGAARVPARSNRK